MAASRSLLAFAVLLLTSSFGQSDSLRYENEGLVTRINCQVRDIQNFIYSSTTDLWGMMGGQIVLTADVALHCLGDDSEGKYGPEALKYKVEISNLQISENKEDRVQSMTREKRGAKEFFSRSWTEVKDFFKRVFGRKPKPQPEVTRAAHPDVTEASPTEEPEEDLDLSEYNSLYSAPFQFVQLANGSIPEIRFAENEVDARVKNFKRHLVDAFSTQLSPDRRVVEKTVIGEHTSNYNISVTGEKASLTDDEDSVLKANRSTVVVKKMVTGEDILRLAPSAAVNDPDKMDLRLEQVQIFQEGQMVQSSGITSLTLMPNSETKSNRLKREAHDVTAYLQAQTTFDIQLQRRQRRSSAFSAPEEMSENVQYLTASRMAEMEGKTRRWKLRYLPDPDVDTEEIFRRLLDEHEETDYEDKLEALFRLIEREVSLELDGEANSISNCARKFLSEEVMQDLCQTEFSICKDFLQLLAVVSGDEVEKVFLTVLSAETRLSTENFRMVADIVSDVSRPSPGFLLILSEMIKDSAMDPSVRGTLAISLGYLASKAAPEDKSKVSGVFIGILHERQSGCQLDSSFMNVLVAIGNLKSDQAASDILEVSKACRGNSSVQITCAHALRYSIHLPLVQKWIQNAIAEGNCELLSEIVASLTDTVNDQEMTPEDKRWPRFGFNDIDNLLRDHLMNESCSDEETIIYFRRKKNIESNEIAKNYFEPESEPWNPRSNSRQKRSAWDELNCQDWTEDHKFVTIQDREEFATDRATYNKRKGCLGFKKFGIKGANAEIFAGVFAGVKEPSSPPKYKLFTKFVSQLNFLGQELQIGSFRFYHQNGKMSANVKIMGRTRQEFMHDGCTPTDLTYRPLKHVPLFNVNIGIAQLSLGVQISSQLGIVTSCPGKEEYVLEPLTNVRVGGEALGTVLFMRGAANLGGSFNYKLQFTFTPSPDMCLKGSHGHDPMNISFETYYQLWNKLKDDWGKVRTWRPGFLSWNVTSGGLKPWFKDTCIAPKQSFLNSERELE